MFTEDLYLSSPTAKALYEKYAKDLPIIDYHCHLSPKEIRENRPFTNLGELWLAHDHYKWRAMRAFGIDEDLITGNSTWRDKFLAFAKIMPALAGNPLYIWCALELKRYFGVGEALCGSNAGDIYVQTEATIAERAMSPSYFINESNVEFIATTDDPADDLADHRAIAHDWAYAKCKIVPAFRPDRAMSIEKPGFAQYVRALACAAGVPIRTFGDLIKALEVRLIAFKAAGAMLNDNGLSGFNWVDYTEWQIESIFRKSATNLNTDDAADLTVDDINRYRSAFLYEMSKLYVKHGFIVQYHAGAYRNTNSAMFAKLGPDSGYDGVDEAVSIRAFGTLFDRLNAEGRLPRTILYPLDINQFEAFAALAANFGGGRGWVQLGAPWWFNDQYYGITKQFESVGNYYPVSLSVGMLTDSRSFLSYPRHELYRRALCAYLGNLVDRGEYFSGEDALAEIIRDVCYLNAKRLFIL